MQKETFRLTIDYCHTISEPEDWRSRHTFMFSHVHELKSVRRNAYGNYSVVLISDKEPYESYRIDDRPLFGYRNPSNEFLSLYCIRNGNEYTFPNVQCFDFK